MTCTNDEAALLLLTLSRIHGEDITPDTEYYRHTTLYRWKEGAEFLNRLRGLVLVSDADLVINIAMEDAGGVSEESRQGMRDFLSNLKCMADDWEKCVQEDPEHALELLMDE